MNSLLITSVVGGSLSYVTYKYIQNKKRQREYQELKKVFDEYDKNMFYSSFFESIDDVKNDDDYGPFRVINFENIEEVILP